MFRVFRATLQAVNFVLAVAGVCMCCYAVYMYIDFEHIDSSHEADSGAHSTIAHWVMEAKKNASPWYASLRLRDTTSMATKLHPSSKMAATFAGSFMHLVVLAYSSS